MRVEVVYAEREQQVLRVVNLESGATVAQALQVALRGVLPKAQRDALRAGVWGKPVARSTRLKDGDRVELYRPLLADPREARRELAAAGRALKGRRRVPDR